MGLPSRSFAADAHDCTWFGSAWNPPNTSVWRDVPRLMASSPRIISRIIYCPIHSPISHTHRPEPTSRPPTAVDGQAQGPAFSSAKSSAAACQKRRGSHPARRRRHHQELVQVGTQGPPTRRAARLVAVAARARGSLLCTTWTSRIVRALDQCVDAGNTLDS
jgi:hypothetical protein